MRKESASEDKSAFAEADRILKQSHKFDSDYQRSSSTTQNSTGKRNPCVKISARICEPSRRSSIEAKAEFQKDLGKVQALNDALHMRLESLAEENAQTLKAEREKLWQSLTDEWGTAAA